MDIPTSELSDKIKEILKDADLEKITSKLVRCQLEEHFNCSLTCRRNEIDKIIMSTLNPPQPSDSSSDDLSSDDASNLSLSELEPQRSSKKAPKKRSSSVGAKNGAAKPRQSKPAKLSDEELARQLQAAENGMRVRQRVNMSTLPWYTRKPKKRSSEENGDAPKKKKGKVRLCLLSEPLADLCGERQMTRCNVVKRMWEIAKERNLFDPSNRQFIICDEDFERVFNKRRLRMFTIMKYLSPYMKDIDEIM